MTKQDDGRVIAIGNFDGLHLGHRALMEELHKKSQQMGLPATVLTFDPHPLHFFSGRGPDLLLSKRQKEIFLYKYFAVDDVVFVRFDAQLAALSPRQFVEQVLLAQYQCRHLIVGFNFHFGKNMAGDAEMLRDLGQEYGVGVSIIPPVISKYGLVSSSAVRDKILHSQLNAANAMLGYNYFIAGPVLVGQQLGRTIDFPTANIEPPENKPLPAYGVYAVRAELGWQTYDGVADFGVRPTVGDQLTPRLETHLFLQGSPDLYDRLLTVYFCSYLRPERRFDDLLQLQEQLKKDKAEALQFFSTYPADQHLPKPIK